MTPDRGWKEDFHMTYMDHGYHSARSLLPATCHEGISKMTFSSRSPKGGKSHSMPARIYLILI